VQYKGYLLLVDIVLFIQFIHPVYVDENEYNKDVDSTLLGKPKPEFGTPYTDVIEGVDHKNAEHIGDQKPDRKKYRQIAEIVTPILLEVLFRHGKLFLSIRIRPIPLKHCC
jgi:hypothetical protein